MMVRSFTIGIPACSRSKHEMVVALSHFHDVLQARCEAAALTPRTVRLTLPPPTVDVEANPGALRSLVESVRELADSARARWYCLPINLFVEEGRQALLEEAQALVLRDSKLFLNLIAASDNEIAMAGVQTAARFVLDLARRSSNGIDNFRVGISAACPSGTPFFPFSRHEGSDYAFSIAMETTPTALSVARAARDRGSTMTEFREKLIAALTVDMRHVDAVGRTIAKATGFAYHGLDASFAPFPDGKTSVAALVQLLGVSPIGAHGSVFATSVLSDALKSAAKNCGARTTGFNGVMYSILEDNQLADANNVHAISLPELALLSTVCGCGIDMAPVPTTMFAEDLAGLVLDIAALAIRLRKPLGLRLLPIPRKSVNEHTQFNLDFLCDSRVMEAGVNGSAEMLGDVLWHYSSTANGLK